MKIEYTKEGMKITCSSGTVQVLSVEELTRIKESQERFKEMVNGNIAQIDTYIAEARKMSN